MIAEPTAPTFGKFTIADDFDVTEVASQVGLDPAFLKAIIAAESTGDWDRNRNPVEVSGHRLIYPYIGMFESDANKTLERMGWTPDGWPDSRYAQITVLAYRLKQLEDDVLAQQVAAMWFNEGRTSGGSGDWTVHRYVEEVMRFTDTVRKQR